jgi:hypothetical protein
MAYDVVTRHAVRNAYVYHKQPLETAAVNAGIPVSTARRWKRNAKVQGDDWEQARLNIGSELKQKAVGGFLDVFLELQTGVINDMLKSDMTPEEKAATATKIADAFIKTVKAGSRFSPDHMMLVATQNVLKELGSYIVQHHPETATTFLELIEPFSVHMLRLAEKE